MKKHRSNKSHNSLLTRCLDRLLPFDFIIEHIPDAKILLVDYNSHQPNQKAKVTNKNDEKFAVATTTRFCDATAAIYTNSAPISCQSHHFNAINRTHSTRASFAQKRNNYKLLSALNTATNQLLLSTTVNAPQVQPTNSSITSAPNTSPQTPSATTTGRVTFQSTLNSGVNATMSSSEGSTTPNLELSKKSVRE